MKIEVTDYIIKNLGKKSFLNIIIGIDYPNGKHANTKAVIDFSNLGYFKGRIPAVSLNFLYFSAIVYAIDRAVKREKHSIDGWSREFEVAFKLPDSGMFTDNQIEIESLLSYLTGDFWQCTFLQCEDFQLTINEDRDIFDDVSQVNLFSGGMDSLIGAIDFFASNIEGKVFLSSHYDSNMGGPKSDQQRLLHEFEEKYHNRYVLYEDNNPILIKTEITEDTTCRSRSLMFIALALQVAVYTNSKIVVPENGSVSLNFPLSVSRRASCSTRTTHPVILYKLQNLFCNFGLSVSLENPYELMTKGEMVTQCKNRDFLLQVLPLSNSCGKRGRRQYFVDNPLATHCGRCMPCMYRKAALVGFNDTTTYGITMNSLYKHKKQKISDDFFAMLNFLKKDLSDEDIYKELNIAGLGRFEQLPYYVELVKRTRLELKNLVVNEGNESILNYLNIAYD